MVSSGFGKGLEAPNYKFSGIVYNKQTSVPQPPATQNKPMDLCISWISNAWNRSLLFTDSNINLHKQKQYNTKASGERKHINPLFLWVQNLFSF
jgi:hypothetical protein